MKKTLEATIVVALGMLAATSIAAGGRVAKTYHLSARMDTRQVVTVGNKPWHVPPALSKARGTFTGTFDRTTGRLTWKVTFSALEGQKVRIVDIHYGRPGRFGAFLARACVGCRSGQRGVVKVKAAARKDIAAGNAWVTLISEHYPNGVIRGQLKIS